MTVGNAQVVAPQRDAATDARSLLEVAWGVDPVPLPVDPVRIAASLGIRVVRDDSLEEDISGAIVKREGHDPVILLNAKDHRNRTRFTCAHELGHYVHRAAKGQGEYDFVDLRGMLASAGTDPEEIYANQFAAELLMPAEDVKRLHKKDFSVAAMAARFEVSAEAMGFRVRNLGLG